MNRYIDADALAYIVASNGDADFINKVTRLMIEAPSIDIVFCKECKYRIHTPAAPNKNRPCETHPELNNCGLRKGLKPQVKLYDFCSYGKRRVINDEM